MFFTLQLTFQIQFHLLFKNGFSRQFTNALQHRYNTLAFVFNQCFVQICDILRVYSFMSICITCCIVAGLRNCLSSSSFWEIAEPLGITFSLNGLDKTLHSDDIALQHASIRHHEKLVKQYISKPKTNRFAVTITPTYKGENSQINYEQSRNQLPLTLISVSKNERTNKCELISECQKLVQGVQDFSRNKIHKDKCKMDHFHQKTRSLRFHK